MLNVIQVVEDLKIGGLERVIENFVLHADTEEFSMSVLCLSKGGAIADALRTAGRDVDILDIRNYHSPLSVARVVQWLKKKKADIVHTHGYPAGVLGRVAAIIAGSPCIIHHVHSTYLELNRRHHSMEKLLSRFSRRIICCSESVKHFVRDRENIAHDKLTVLYNGVAEPRSMDRQSGAELRSTLGIPEGSPVVGCVASLTRHKGYRYLLEAFKETGDAVLLIIGDGPERKELEQLSRDLEISNRVIFAGHKMDVSPYVHIMDIAVLPSSEREGLGISIIEAMALSKPVIATAVGGLPEVVEDGRTGILVKPKHSSSLATALHKLLASPHLRKDMGARGKKRYEKMFSLHEMIKKLEDIYGDYN
jgi:glycosyltransferase involved in cell wall biosynthesis